MKKVEIAPGVFFQKEKGHFKISFLEPGSDKELIAWDYEEICGSADAWFSSLKAISLATQYGPSVAKDWVEQKRIENGNPAGSLVCNVCDRKFVVEINRPFAFIVRIGGRNYHDYQCSEECNKKRYKNVYEGEMGGEFMKLWKNLKDQKLESRQL